MSDWLQSLLMLTVVKVQSPPRRRSMRLRWNLFQNSATSAELKVMSYDKTGNRLTKKVGTAAIQNYTYATTSHRLTNVGSVARTLDANGNTSLASTTKRLTYDARNRMVDVRTSSTTASIVSKYQYNAKGERVRKYLGSTDQDRYFYDESGQLLVQYKIISGGTTTQEIIWLDNMPIGINHNGSLHGILTDHLNSPRKAKICANRKGLPTSVVGIRDGQNDIDVSPDMNRFGDRAQGLNERTFKLGYFQLKTTDINVIWCKLNGCDCFTYSSQMYVLENTGDNSIGAGFSERDVIMGRWNLIGRSCCAK